MNDLFPHFHDNSGVAGAGDSLTYASCGEECVPARQLSESQLTKRILICPDKGEGSCAAKASREYSKRFTTIIE